MAEVLLIDDDINIHQIVSLFLEEVGYPVHSATSGKAGLILAEQTFPDLILLDIAMPGMDGISVLRALRANPTTADIPVLIFTVHDKEDVATEIAKYSRVGYLMKPVDMYTLQTNVSTVLSSTPRQPAASPAYS
ncbi:MAG TPA: response regulator [Magnetovibrio sp.]